MDARGASVKIHGISSCLKLYLRELEDPVLTHSLYEKWIEFGNSLTSDQGSDPSLIDTCRSLIVSGLLGIPSYWGITMILTECCSQKSIPLEHQDVLHFFIPFLRCGGTTGCSCWVLLMFKATDFIARDSLVAEQSVHNKMTIQNLAVVFGPTLLQPLQNVRTLSCRTCRVRVMGVILCFSYCGLNCTVNR